MADSSASWTWPEDWEKALPAVEQLVRSACYRALLSEADAEEIYSLVAEKIWFATFQPHPKKQAIRDFATISSLVAWSGWVTASSIANRWKRQSRERNATTIDLADLPASETTAGGLEEYLDLLDDEEEQTALRLRFEEDCSFDEIAGHMQVSSATARRLVISGLRKLQRRLGG
jgi:RNA polymerase sigma factor (sigma-70 family)